MSTGKHFWITPSYGYEEGYAISDKLTDFEASPYFRCTAARTFFFSSGAPCCDTLARAFRACDRSLIGYRRPASAN